METVQLEISTNIQCGGILLSRKMVKFISNERWTKDGGIYARDLSDRLSKSVSKIHATLRLHFFWKNLRCLVWGPPKIHRIFVKTVNKLNT